MPVEQTTRLAIVRCDSHAYWYGVMFAECDPLVLRDNRNHDPAHPTAANPPRESVHHYMKVLGAPHAMAVKPIERFTIARVWDENPAVACDFAATFYGRPYVCRSIEEATEGVDAVFIADSSTVEDGADHLRLARPFLERGIPCFVDKPFASTLADAREMIDLARKHHTPVMSASILSHTRAGELFRRRFDEIGEPRLLVAKGKGPETGAVIHGLAAAQGLFGYGVTSVECMGPLPMQYIQLQYPDGREALIINGPNTVFPRTCSFYVSVYSNRGVLHSPDIGDPEFVGGAYRIAQRFRQMIDTGRPPIDYTHMLEPIAIIEAARTAQRERRRVRLDELEGFVDAA